MIKKLKWFISDAWDALNLQNGYTSFTAHWTDFIPIALIYGIFLLWGLWNLFHQG